MHKKHFWKAVKNLKGKFTPKYIQMRNRGGTLVPLKKRAEAIVDYLEKCQWTNNVEEGKIRQIKQDPLRNLTETQKETAKTRQRASFSVKELNEAIQLSKEGKAPGPDGIKMELVKWLDSDSRKWLLNTINKWWEDKKAPEELYHVLG